MFCGSFSSRESSYRTQDQRVVLYCKTVLEPHWDRRNKDQPQGGMTNRFCLPLAELPSSLSTSESSGFPRTSTKPLKSALVREGLEGLERTTHPFFVCITLWSGLHK